METALPVPSKAPLARILRRIAHNLLVSMQRFCRLRATRYRLVTPLTGRVSGRHANDALAHVPAGKQVDKGVRCAF